MGNISRQQPENNSTRPTPHKAAELLIERIYNPYEAEQILGDLYEVFQRRTKTMGYRKAHLLYWADVIRFINPLVKKRRLVSTTSRANFLSMVRNYLLILGLKALKHPLSVLLNVTCLTLGITGTLLILLYLNFELSFDKVHQKADRIYRISTSAIKTHDKQTPVSWNSTPAPLGPVIKKEYAGVEAYVRLFKFWNSDQFTFHYNQQSFQEENVYAADATVFDVFSFDLLAGDYRTALKGPNKVVVSQNFARRIFGKQDPMGKLIGGDMSIPGLGPTSLAKGTLLVTGVFRDLPANVHLPVEAMLSADTDPGLSAYYYNTFNVFTYVLVAPTVLPERFAKKLTDIYRRHLDPGIEPVLVSADHNLVPLLQIHRQESGGMTYIYAFSAVGMLLLFMAGISYVNLTTAQASQRSLEIGIRKVLGSPRGQLIGQFLVESVLLTLLSLVLGCILVLVLTKSLNDHFGLTLDINKLVSSDLLLGMGAIILLLGLVGGSYPALVLSSLRPIKVLKNKAATKAPLRRLLIGIQFAVVLFGLRCTGMIDRQLEYVRTKNLGFTKEHLVRLSLPEQEDVQKWTVLKALLLEHPSVEAVGSADFTPGNGDMVKGPVSANGTMGEEPKFVQRGNIDDHFLQALDIKLVAGRNFSADFPGDSAHAVIVNQAFVKTFGLTTPLGAKVRFGDKGNPNFLQIVGIIHDFHQSSLHHPIEPQLFRYQPGHTLVIRLGNNLKNGLDQVEKSWLKVFPTSHLAYQFLDDELQDGYKNDQIRARIFILFSLLTLVIAFLGLFGLASYLVRQRRKELSIRKVFGAQNAQIVWLMSRDFLGLVLVASAPAFLASWYLTSQWLHDFAFQVPIAYTLYGLVLLFIGGLTLLTTGFQVLKLVRQNPVINLKDD